MCSSVTAIRKPKESDVPPKFLYGLHLNTGIGFQVFSEKGDFAALQFRYNLGNYWNKGGTKLGGNFFSIGLLFSLTKSNDRYKRKSALRQLGV